MWTRTFLLLLFLSLVAADKEAQDAHDVQNAFRVLHGMRPLLWDDALASHARDWAMHVVSQKRLEEITSDSMNLAWSSGAAWPAAKAACHWYVEGIGGGHYRQMMSNEATRSGVGVARSDDFGTVVIAVYDNGYYSDTPPSVCPHLVKHL